MSLAWEEARENFGKVCLKIGNFKDGDFKVNYGYHGFGMMCDELPTADKVYDKILEFAKKRNYKVVELGIRLSRNPEPDFILQRNIESPKNLKEKIKKSLHIREDVLYVGDHFFTSVEPQIFEEFGREVHGLKTGAEIEYDISKS